MVFLAVLMGHSRVGFLLDARLDIFIGEVSPSLDWFLFSKVVILVWCGESFPVDMCCLLPSW